MMAGMEKLTINTDGGARGNPGPAGIGGVIYNQDGDEVATVSEYIGETTNNVAEYTAIVRTLTKAKEVVTDPTATEIHLRLDSQLAERQLNGAYKVKDANLRNYFNEVKALVEDFADVQFEHVLRTENKRADELANEAMDNGS